MHRKDLQKKIFTILLKIVHSFKFQEWEVNSLVKAVPHAASIYQCLLLHP